MLSEYGLTCECTEHPQKTSHCDPPENAHGLCLANPCRVGFVGGVGSGKTTTLLNIIARCAEWKPFENIYLMGPTGCVQDMAKGDCIRIQAGRILLVVLIVRVHLYICTDL
eukprot:SAG25_NODE_86_length_16515_cov_5.529996_21_plen_111_part_00